MINTLIILRCEFKTTRKLNNGEPASHVTMWGTYGIGFYGCNFEYSAGSSYIEGSRGTGILSMDANYYIDRYLDASLGYVPSTFISMTNGVRLLNSNSMCGAVITNSRFEDNTRDGVYFKNSYHFMFRENNIRTLVSNQSNGVYINNCKYYTIKNNNFEETNNGFNTSGLYIWNSGAGAHNVFRNSFSGFGAALNAVDNNCGYNNPGPGLKMNCNDFTSVSNEYDIAMFGFGSGLNAPTVMKKQGEVYFPSSGKVVRNKYGANCGSMNKWYVDGQGTSTITIDHGSNSSVGGNTATTRPLPQPSCSHSVVNVVNSNIVLNYTADCPAYPPSITSGSPLSSLLDNYNSSISAQRTTGFTLDTFELQTAVSGKIDAFLRDSIEGSRDSVIAILANNDGYMRDAPVQLAFAYINKKDYTSALNTINELPEGDWQTLLLALLDIYQAEGGIYSILTNTTQYALLEDYATADYKDGSSLAQNILYFVAEVNFTEPRMLPGNVGARHAQPESVKADLASEKTIRVYPNPAQNAITVDYYSSNEGTALVELRDLLGRLIHTVEVNKDSKNIVSLSNYSSGIYILTVMKNKTLLYKTKLIKQD